MVYIKAGIMLIVTTWENDADNYVNKTLDGLTKECANAIAEFCKQFKSKNAKPFGAGFGNAEYRGFDVEYVAENLQEEQVNLIIEETGMELHDLFVKLIGTWCDGEYVRVFDKLIAIDVPVDIHTVDLS
jgi:hypothetical protein